MSDQIFENINSLLDDSEFDAMNLTIENEDLYLIEGDEDDLDAGLDEALAEAGFGPVNESEIQEGTGLGTAAATTIGNYVKQKGVEGNYRAIDMFQRHGGTAGDTTSSAANTAIAVGTAIAANPLAVVGVGAAIVALAGGAAYAIVRYIGSIYRLNRVVNALKKKISATTDPAKKSALTAKLQKYTQKLEAAKAKAREKKKGFIAQTNAMKTQIATMKKAGQDTTKLQKKLDARMKVMSKIGAV